MNFITLKNNHQTRLKTPKSPHYYCEITKLFQISSHYSKILKIERKKEIGRLKTEGRTSKFEDQ